MADGRDHIESTWAIVTEMADKADELRAGMSDAQVEEFNMYLESAQKWGALCRRKSLATRPGRHRKSPTHTRYGREPSGDTLRPGSDE